MRPVRHLLIKILLSLVLAVLEMGAMAGWAMNRAEPSKNMLPNGKFPITVIAHRGFSGIAPENTLAAFKKAIEAGSDMIELDVRLSLDGEVVVIHDESLERTTNGKGKVIESTLQELKRLDAGSKFQSSFSGETIPSLREVLQWANRKISLNIELKKGDYGRWTLPDLAFRTLQEVEKAGMNGQVLFSSFDSFALETVLKRKSGIPVAYLYNRPWNVPREVTGGRPYPILNCRKSILTRENISRAHQEGIRVGVYTLNTDEEMERFIDLEVNAIITDFPDRLIKILQRRYR